MKGLTVNLMRISGVRPRVHGNGFIQYDIDDRIRLHVWGDPRIPKQKVATPIHDHGFGFTSRVLKGSMTNTLYKFSPHVHGDFRVYRAVSTPEGEDSSRLEPTGIIGKIRAFSTDIILAGGEYRMEPFVYHESKVEGPTATMIFKDGPTMAQGGSTPRVLVGVNQKPDNEFSRYDADEELLWQIIEDVIGQR